MAGPEVTNWFGDVVSHPSVIVDANSVADIVAVMKDPKQYPSPVRAVGSNHSTAPCGVADGGTLIRMRMNRILNIGADTMTVEAGARHIDMARELEKRNLQFYVNTEIGSLTAGSAACAGTKDASFPGEFGQVGSYVIGMKLVLPNGELLEITDAQPDLMQKARSSYGLFGVVYEVTYRIRPLMPMKVYHETFTLEEFVAKLELAQGARRVDDAVHLSLFRPRHGRVPQLQSRRDRGAEPLRLDPAQLSLGNSWAETRT